jgi:hypothetical protein
VVCAEAGSGWECGGGMGLGWAFGEHRGREVEGTECYVSRFGL